MTKHYFVVKAPKKLQTLGSHENQHTFYKKIRMIIMF